MCVYVTFLHVSDITKCSGVEISSREAPGFDTRPGDRLVYPVFVVFPSFPTEILGMYFKIGRCLLMLHPSQLIFHIYFPVHRYTTFEVEKASLNKLRDKWTLQ
jgi:hypothetical protein